MLQLVCGVYSMWLFFGLLLSLPLSGCQMVQRVFSFPESGRDWELGQVLSQRSALEEQYRQCLIEQDKGQTGETGNASDNCSAYKAQLKQPIVLPAEQ